VAPHLKALAFTYRGIINQFTGLWPSPKAMDMWMQKNWIAMIQCNLLYYFCGRGYYPFLFEKMNAFEPGTLDFMGPRGMYLNHWMLYFMGQEECI
jgi:hypothetical protein